jgi:hypothetical protein
MVAFTRICPTFCPTLHGILDVTVTLLLCSQRIAETDRLVLFQEKRKMKNRRLFGFAAFTLLGFLALNPLVRTQAQGVVAPMPDLTIQSVTRSGTTAFVTIKNIGSANAPQCVLRCYYWNGHGWGEMVYTAQYVTLAAGATTVREITHANVGTAQFQKYVIDVTNVAAESNENNNIKYIPDPTTTLTR